MKQTIFTVIALVSSIFISSFAIAKEKKEAVKSYEIAPGSQIQIPKSWKFNTYFMPPDLSATNIRIYTKGVTIAITGMYELKGEDKTPEDLEKMLQQATLPYVQQSTEQSFTPVHFTTPTTIGVYTSYTAANKSAGLRTLPNEISLKTTTAIVYKTGSIFSISISLNKNNKAGLKNYQSAIDALSTIQ